MQLNGRNRGDTMSLEKYIESVEISPEGYPITKYRYVEPKERTFLGIVGGKYTIANLGYQRANATGVSVDHIGDTPRKRSVYKPKET